MDASARNRRSFNMNHEATFFDETSECLTKFIQLSNPDIEAVYPQLLNEDFTVGNAQDACARLWARIHHNKLSLDSVISREPSLKLVLRDFLWLQRSIMHTVDLGSANVSHFGHAQFSHPPSMTTQCLMNEIEECAWYILDLISWEDDVGSHN